MKIHLQRRYRQKALYLPNSIDFVTTFYIKRNGIENKSFLSIYKSIYKTFSFQTCYAVLCVIVTSFLKIYRLTSICPYIFVSISHSLCEFQICIDTLIKILLQNQNKFLATFDDIFKKCLVFMIWIASMSTKFQTFRKYYEMIKHF